MGHREWKFGRPRDGQAADNLAGEDHHYSKPAQENPAAEKQPAQNIDMRLHIVLLFLLRRNGRHHFAAAFAAEASMLLDVVSTVRAKHVYPLLPR